MFSPGRVAASTNSAGFSYAAAGPGYAVSNPASYYEVTAGLTWKPYNWLRLRPNVRYDWADGHIGNANYRPYGDVQNGNSNGKLDQFLFSADMTINF